MAKITKKQVEKAKDALQEIYESESVSEAYKKKVKI